jgi:hypothetical protein
MIQQDLEAMKQEHSEAQSLIEVANGDLHNYKSKICELVAFIG